MASPLGAIRYKVYTKTGDAGTTSLYNGARLPKDDAFFGALGDVDELNACIGLAREHCAALGVGLEEQLAEVQSRLLDAGSAIATPASTSRAEQLARAAFRSDITGRLEGWIDAMEEALPPLKNFILPSGGLASAHLHVARTVCRRAERQATALSRGGELPLEVPVFLNRLSDYLFVAARFACLKCGGREEVYKKAQHGGAAPEAAASSGGGGDATGSAPPAAGGGGA